MINTTILNPDIGGAAHCIKADNFCWQHICFPRQGFVRTGVLVAYE